MNQLAKRNFIKTATAFLSASAKHFVSKLALDNTVLRDGRHFQPSFRQRQLLPSAISRLAMVCANVFDENRRERSLDWSKMPQSLTYGIQLSWNVMSTKQKTFYSHTTWFKSSQKEGETKYLTGNLSMKWLVLIWVMPVLKKRTLRELISTGIRYMMGIKW